LTPQAVAVGVAGVLGAGVAMSNTSVFSATITGSVFASVVCHPNAVLQRSVFTISLLNTTQVMKDEWETNFKEIYNGFFPDEKFLRILENVILE
jgi:hypothetical protein